ncbi:hypothetical protein HY496_02660, partial [Candidatus Woesearchaeota archaeon]|nr:hypothetical protein [Candidatus Woesearchaeota archaeon]
VLAKVGFAEVVEKLEKAPSSQSRFATVTKEELGRSEEESSEHYEDSEDFGEEK